MASAGLGLDDFAGLPEHSDSAPRDIAVEAPTLSRVAASRRTVTPSSTIEPTRHPQGLFEYPFAIRAPPPLSWSPANLLGGARGKPPRLEPCRVSKSNGTRGSNAHVSINLCSETHLPLAAKRRGRKRRKGTVQRKSGGVTRIQSRTSSRKKKGGTAVQRGKRTAVS